MRRPEPTASTPTARTPKVWLAGIGVGIAVAVAVLGAAAAAQADGTPSPTTSDDVAYQAGTPGEQAGTPSESVQPGLVVVGASRGPGQPADLTPEELQSLYSQLTIDTTTP
jgi:hypothetical protein